MSQLSDVAWQVSKALGHRCPLGPMLEDPLTGEVIQAPCWSSTCPVCGVRVARALAQSFNEVAGRKFFVTLTFAPEYLPADGKAVTTLWARANTALHRRCSWWPDTVWARRIEVGPNGTERFHLHLIVASPDLSMDLYDWQDLLESVWPFGFVHVKAVKGGAVGLANYLCGYLTIFQKKVSGSLSKCRKLALRVSKLTRGDPWDRERRRRARLRYNFVVQDHNGRDVLMLRRDIFARALDPRPFILASINRIRSMLDGSAEAGGVLFNIGQEVGFIWVQAQRQEAERIRRSNLNRQGPLPFLEWDSSGELRIPMPR